MVSDNASEAGVTDRESVIQYRCLCRAQRILEVITRINIILKLRIKI